MINEELLKTEQSVEPVPLLGIFATEIPAYLKGSVCRLMDAARKDEALKVFEYIITDGVPFWFTTTPEQLYELFKNRK